jgi:3-oxoacyl-[acyl-carrier protein] reductase
MRRVSSSGYGAGMDLRDKAALVTGGGTGVGRATTLALAERGCAVVVNYSRSKDEAEETAAEARALGVEAFAYAADVADDASVREMVAAAGDQFGRLDVLVNNAGRTVFVPHADMDALSDDDWLSIYAVNTLGPFHCARAAKALLQADGGGHVVNISSVAGVAGVGSSLPYCASKAALLNLTVTLARVMAPSVRVNAVAPGFITGRWLQAGLGQAYEAVKARAEQNNPLQAVCDPEDVANAILAVVTGGDLMTGQTLTVDGGSLLR